jgi:hypothetical protein
MRGIVNTPCDTTSVIEHALQTCRNIGTRYRVSFAL